MDAESDRRRIVLDGLYEFFGYVSVPDTALGLQLGKCETDQERRQTFEDVLRTKATATLDKRWFSLKLYARWFRAARPHRALEVVEADAE